VKAESKPKSRRDIVRAFVDRITVAEDEIEFSEARPLLSENRYDTLRSHELILKTKRNEYRPPVESKSLRNAKAVKAPV
jgi:hypothetical protein